MRPQSLRLAIIAGTVSLPALLTVGTATAQTVQMFDEAPTVEQLRRIMIPESHGALTRRIVLPNTEAARATGSFQAVAAQAPAVSPPAQTEQAQDAAPEPAGGAPEAQATESAAPAQADREERRAAHRPAARPHVARVAAQPQAMPGAGIVGFRINFAFDSDAVPAPYAVFIQRIGALMQQEPQLKLRIEGHTDAVGSDGYNLALSQHRALAVAKFLVQLHIDPERLSIAGKGKTEPLEANPYDPRNRRVQFVRVE